MYKGQTNAEIFENSEDKKVARLGHLKAWEKAGLYVDDNGVLMIDLTKIAKSDPSNEGQIYIDSGVLKVSL